MNKTKTAPYDSIVRQCTLKGHQTMKKLNLCITKNCLIRALRTFLQTAIGYVITNVALNLSGVDFSDKNMVKNVLIGLAISALSAGAAAVMNIEKADKGENKDG